MPGIEDVAYGLARGVTKAVCDELVANGPALMTGIVGAYRAAWASTIVNETPDPSLDANLQKQINDEIKAGTLGGPGA